MAVNNLSFNQLSTVLTSIVNQATGASVLTPTTTGEFVSVAQTGLQNGYDPLMTAISQVLSRTIFSIRPYYRKLGGLMVDEITYGNHVRKLTTVDKPFEDDDRLLLVDGQAVDQYKVNKPQVLQTNFYGENVYQKSLTIYRDQLDSALNSPEEFGRFLSMIMQNAADMIEQAHESVARMTLANLIGGVYASNTKSVIHLLTDYNTATGLSLTTTTVRAPENYVPYIKWCYSRIKSISDLLTERSQKYHVNVTGSEVNRHTPLERQRIYLSALEINEIETSVFSSTFHNDFLRIGAYERVNFWQSIDSPYTINVTPTYMLPSGTLETPDSPVSVDNIMGIVMDEEAAGLTVVNQWSASTPFNARGGYSNIFWHFTDRFWNDFTENAVVFLMD